MGGTQAVICNFCMKTCGDPLKGSSSEEEAVVSRAESVPDAAEIVGTMEAMDALIQKLFELQDLNGNGVLEEEELIQLNKKVAMLHKGKDIDKEEVRVRYRELFRSCLDAEGEPVPLTTFRRHILDVLRTTERNNLAQTFILEQWIAEADQARVSFSTPSMHSISDIPFLLVMPKLEPSGLPGGPKQRRSNVRVEEGEQEERDRQQSPKEVDAVQEREEEGSKPRRRSSDEDTDGDAGTMSPCPSAAEQHTEAEVDRGPLIDVPAPPPSEVPSSAVSSISRDAAMRSLQVTVDCRRISEEMDTIAAL